MKDLLRIFAGDRSKKNDVARPPPSQAPAPPAVQPSTPSTALDVSAPGVSSAKPKPNDPVAQRIAQWTKSPTDTLRLNGLKLKSIPEIKNVARVRSLDLSDNQLTDEALAELAKFSGLVWLSLRKNKIGPEGIRRLATLPAVATLDLSGNGIGDSAADALAELRSVKRLLLNKNGLGPTSATAIARIQGLVTLDLQDNQIGDAGMIALSNLTSLTKLNIIRNQITAEGAPGIARLTKLVSLQISGNKIGVEGARAFASLKNLSLLHIAETTIGSGAEDALRELVALKTLDLTNSGFESIEFLDGKSALESLTINGLRIREVTLQRLKSVKRLHAHKARLGDVPPELLSKNPTDNCLNRVRTYLTAQEKAPKVIVRDARIMILGNGRVGKTQMRRRLVDEPFNEKEGSTHGAVVVRGTLPPPKGAPADAQGIPLKIWDFGGQDIYLGTHALFIKPPAVFPILWTEADEAEPRHNVEELIRTYPLAEWLHYVRQLAGEKCPVLLVQAKCDTAAARTAPHVPQRLTGQFEFPPIEMRYCAKAEGNTDLLLANLREAVGWLEKDGPRKIPTAWANIKDEIEKRASQGVNRLTRAEFDALCGDAVRGRDERTLLLETLDSLGVIFHDQALFPDLIILDLNWALRAIYSIFDRSIGINQVLRHDRGRFTRSLLGTLLWDVAKFDKAEQQAFINMMVSCGVAFEFRAASENLEALYVAPELLPEREDVAAEIAEEFPADQADAERAFQLTFAIPALLRELMRMWGSRARILWRDGLCFFDTATGSRAMLEIVRHDRSWRAEVRIKTREENAALLLERLTATVLEVAERFGSEVEGDFAPAPPEDPDVELQASAVAILPGPQPAAVESCFISYKRKVADTALAAAIDRLRALTLTPHYDDRELRYGESITRFMRHAAQTPKFVLLIPPEYFKSSYCMEELLLIWEVCSSDRDIFQSRVRAVLLGVTLGEQERRNIMRDWEDRYQQALKNLVNRTGKPEQIADAAHQHDIAFSIQSKIGVMLSAIADGKYIEGVEGIGELTF